MWQGALPAPIPLLSKFMASQAPGGAGRPSLRDALAQAILDAKRSGQAETAKWKERAQQAEATAHALRCQVLTALELPPERPCGDMVVLDAVVRHNDAGGAPLVSQDDEAALSETFWTTGAGGAAKTILANPMTLLCCTLAVV